MEINAGNHYADSIPFTALFKIPWHITLNLHFQYIFINLLT